MTTGRRIQNTPLGFVRVLITAVVFQILNHAVADGKEFCHNEQFTAKCPEHELIVVTLALYGRMRIGTCVKTDFGHVGCFVDVTRQVHERCSGRPSCAIRVPDAVLDRTKPCDEDLKSYLDVNYTCIKVAAPSEVDSCELVSSSGDGNFSGYISNRVSSSSPSRFCGTNETPWVVKVLPGQRINVTLLDFSSTLPIRSPPAPTVPCDQYAVLQEPEGLSSSTTVCGTGRVQRSHIYTSAGNILSVFLKPRKINSTYSYVFKYEAVGCPDLETPPNAWLNRNGAAGEEITIGCVGSEDTWMFVCAGNRWEGSADNCSAVSSKDARREDGLSTLSVGASILTILGVSMTIGIVVLLVGLFYMRSKRIGNVIGQELSMRDLKPLSSEAAVYDTSVVYARNKAFEPVKVNIVRTSGKSLKPDPTKGATETGEYEYVWDSPSNEASRSGQTTAGSRKIIPNPGDDSPDLLKVTRSSPMPAEASPQTQTLPKKQMMGRRFERQAGTLGRVASDIETPMKPGKTSDRSFRVGERGAGPCQGCSSREDAGRGSTGKISADSKREVDGERQGGKDEGSGGNGGFGRVGRGGGGGTVPVPLPIRHHRR